MIVLTKEDMKQCFTMREAIDADKEALRMYVEKHAAVPIRTNIDVTRHLGQSLYMPAYVGGTHEALGVKIVSVYPKNMEQGIPSVPATMVVVNPETGVVEAILDGTYLTQLRTGAVQGAATELLAVENAAIAALIGTGGQAEAQLEAMLTVRDLKEVRVYDIDFQRAQRFANAMQERFQQRIVGAASAQEAVHQADIVTTVTTAKQATFEASWVKPGAHINGVGAYTPEMAEMPREIIRQADAVFVDTLDGCLQEAGDLIQPLADGYITESSITGELGDLITGKRLGRKTDQEITVFKTVGSAVLDVYVASEIVRKAKEKNMGTTIGM